MEIKPAEHIAVLLSQMHFLQIKTVMLFTFVMFYINRLHNLLKLFTGCLKAIIQYALFFQFQLKVKITCGIKFELTDALNS